MNHCIAHRMRNLATVVLLAMAGCSDDDHDHGAEHEHDEHGAEHEDEDERTEVPPGTVIFHEEQQRILPFAVGQASVRAVQPRFTVLGRVAAASGSDVELHAPVAGRLRLAEGVLLTDGAIVEAGMLIGHVVPVPDSRDRIDLERDVEATRVALEYAELERDRVAPLAADGILSEARRNETDAAVAAAQVAHDGARRRLSNWSAVERGDSNGSRIAITAPIGGRISDSALIDGAYVSADESLARITDVGRAVIEAHIPETEVGRISRITSAVVYIASSEQPLEMELTEPPVPAGRVDPATHTLAIRFALPASASVPASGLSARVMFGEGARREVIAVPRSAVGDEDGVSVVYVQQSGELFVRRTVRTGVRDGEYVEIVAGVEAGERIVVEGGWLVRLAASRGAMPSHGHAH